MGASVHGILAGFGSKVLKSSGAWERRRPPFRQASVCSSRCDHAFRRYSRSDDCDAKETIKIEQVGVA